MWFLNVSLEPRKTPRYLTTFFVSIVCPSHLIFTRAGLCFLIRMIASDLLDASSGGLTIRAGRILHIRGNAIARAKRFPLRLEILMNKPQGCCFEIQREKESGKMFAGREFRKFETTPI